MFPGSS